jgi:hypothetical protein
LDRFDPLEQNSPAWARLRCALLETEAAPSKRISDDYEDLIDLDPGCPAHMLALGADMTPGRFGRWDLLDREARRTAARVSDLWGSGGYALVYMGALTQDLGAERQIDIELFVAGLHDIIARHPTQHMANRLAAFCGVAIPGGSASRGTPAERLHACFAWVVQDHLRELHPHIWARTRPAGHEPARDDDEDGLLRRGRTRALACLADYYAPALRAGRRMVFLPHGIELLKTG